MKSKIKFGLWKSPEIRIREKLLVKQLMNHVKRKGGVLEVLEFIDIEHQNTLWYGGNVAEIKYKGYRLVIAAVGDVKVEVADENDNYVGYVKDKNNAGIFYKEFRHFIRDDKHLVKLIANNHIIFENNNWWECFMYLPDGTFVDMMMALESDLLSEAILEVADSMDEILEYGKDN